MKYSAHNAAGPQQNAMNVLICTTYNYKRTRKLIAFIHELLVLEPEMGTHVAVQEKAHVSFIKPE